jgi:hypothetical protein
MLVFSSRHEPAAERLHRITRIDQNSHGFYEMTAIKPESTISRRKIVVVLGTAFTVFVALPALACQVPVFRYALERWQADRYQVVVLHDGPLDRVQQESVARLVAASKGEASAGKTPAGKTAAGDVPVASAIQVETIDVSDPPKGTDPRLLNWWKQNSPNTPQMLVFYPPANSVGRQGPAYSGELNEGNAAEVLDSPIRRQVFQRLEKGDSAVWIFVPCGRKDADAEAKRVLEAQLVEDAKWLELPTAEELEVKPEILTQCKIPLRISFSIVELDRKSAEEEFLLQSLLHSEEDLVDFDQPLAFPVFGQGRVLYCLVGKGIAPDTIRAASSFMAGPCSCQVKNQNPGFDLLLGADWQQALGDVLISEPIETPSGEALEPKLLTIPPGRNTRAQR